MRRTLASVVELATITRPWSSRSSGSTSSSPFCQSGAAATSSTTAQTSSIGAAISADASPPSFPMRGVLPVVHPERPAHLVEREPGGDAGQQLHARRLWREEARGNDLRAAQVALG